MCTKLLVVYGKSRLEIESKKKILEKLDRKRELEGEEELSMLTGGIANYEELREVHREEPTAEIFVRDSADLIKRLNIFGKDASEFDFKIDHFFDQLIENNGYTIRSREFWGHMDQVQNIRGLRDEWIPKWTKFRGRTTVNEPVMNFEQSFKNVPLRRCITERRRRGLSIEALCKDINEKGGIGTRKKRKVIDDEYGEEQKVGQGDTESTNDAMEQLRILKTFLAEFQWKEKCCSENGVRLEDQEPVLYWEFVCVKDYSETIENIFYLSFLIKDDTIVIFNDKNYGLTALAPNYKRLGDAKCKFSWKHNSVLKKYIPNEANIEYAKNFVDHSNKHAAELKQKYVMDRNYVEYGGHPLLSKVSHVHLNQNVHANYVKFFEERAAKNGANWKPTLRRKEKDDAKKEKKVRGKKAK